MNAHTEQFKQGTIIYPEVESLRWTIQQQREEIEKLRTENDNLRDENDRLNNECVKWQNVLADQLIGVDLKSALSRCAERMKGGE